MPCKVLNQLDSNNNKLVHLQINKDYPSQISLRLSNREFFLAPMSNNNLSNRSLHNHRDFSATLLSNSQLLI